MAELSPAATVNKPCNKDPPIPATFLARVRVPGSTITVSTRFVQIPYSSGLTVPACVTLESWMNYPPRGFIVLANNNQHHVKTVWLGVFPILYKLQVDKRSRYRASDNPELFTKDEG